MQTAVIDRTFGPFYKVPVAPDPASAAIPVGTLATPRTVVEQAIQVIEDHLAKEAKNRRQDKLQPRELCPMQKSQLVNDLVNVLNAA